MVTRYRRRSRLDHLVLPVVTVAFLAYFGYHALHGDYGILARAHMVAQTEKLTAELDLLVAERENIQAHVELLRPESTDRDLADERARAAVGLARDDELVILLENGRPASSADLVAPRTGIARLIAKYQ